MPSEPLQGREGDTFLHGGNGKGVSEHVRGHRAIDTGFVGNTLEDALKGASCLSDGVMNGKVSVNQRAYPVCEGNDAALGLCAVDTAFAINHQSVVLPVDVFSCESGQLGDSQAGIE
jgi:hypothetical protein